MGPIVQAVIVAIIVGVSAAFATWRLMPARTKLRVLDGVHPSEGNALGRWLLRLRKRVLAELTHGCGSCSHNADHIQKHTATKRP
jgi:hypothetical protein